MTSLTLKQTARPQFQLVPEYPRQPRTLRRVLWLKLLASVEKAKWRDIRKAFVRTSGVVGIGIAVASPSYALGVVTHAATWNGYKLPVFVTLAFAFVYWKTLYRMLRRFQPKQRAGNQHTFEGIPVDELASYLFEHGFKRDHAMKTFRISKGKYEKIADLFDTKDITARDDNNGRVVNPHITREQLARQLTEDFPLVYYAKRGEWVNRDGTYSAWLRDEENAEQKSRQKTERLERRAAKAKRDIAAAEGFHHRHLFAA